MGEVKSFIILVLGYLSKAIVVVFHGILWCLIAAGLIIYNGHLYRFFDQLVMDFYVSIVISKVLESKALLEQMKQGFYLRRIFNKSCSLF